MTRGSRSGKWWTTSIVGLLVLMMGLSACSSDAATDTTEPEETTTTADSGEATTTTAGESDDTQPEPAPSGFFEGEDINVVVPYNPGGSTDILARLTGPFLTKHLVGSPNVIVENVGGGGTIIGGNEYVLLRDHDGLNAFFTGTSNVLTYILGAPEVEYDLSQMQPIYGFPTTMVITVRTETGIESGADLAAFDGELRMGGRSPEGADSIVNLAMDILGIEYQNVFGYGSGGDQQLAFEQGEVNLNYQGSQIYLSSGAPFVETGDARVLFTLGVVNPSTGELERDPAVPDAPTWVELYEEIHGEPPSGEATDALMTVLNVVTNFGFGMLLHGDAPTEAAEELRAAAVAMVNDPEFDNEETRATIGPYNILVGDAAAAFGESLSNINPDHLRWFRQWLMDNYEVEGLDVG